MAARFERHFFRMMRDTNGFGFALIQQGRAVVVTSVDPLGPAAQIGLRPQDVVVIVNQKDVSNKSCKDIVNIVRRCPNVLELCVDRMEGNKNQTIGLLSNTKPTGIETTKKEKQSAVVNTISPNELGERHRHIVTLVNLFQQMNRYKVNLDLRNLNQELPLICPIMKLSATIVAAFRSSAPRYINDTEFYMHNPGEILLQFTYRLCYGYRTCIVCPTAGSEMCPCEKYMHLIVDVLSKIAQYTSKDNEDFKPLSSVVEALKKMLFQYPARVEMYNGKLSSQRTPPKGLQRSKSADSIVDSAYTGELRLASQHSVPTHQSPVNAYEPPQRKYPVFTHRRMESLMKGRHVIYTGEMTLISEGGVDEKIVMILLSDIFVLSNRANGSSKHSFHGPYPISEIREMDFDQSFSDDQFSITMSDNGRMQMKVTDPELRIVWKHLLLQRRKLTKNTNHL